MGRKKRDRGKQEECQEGGTGKKARSVDPAKPAEEGAAAAPVEPNAITHGYAVSPEEYRRLKERAKGVKLPPGTGVQQDPSARPPDRPADRPADGTADG